MKHKIYCFNNSWSPASGKPPTQWNSGVALAEDGTCLAGHNSSSHSWCRQDMTGGWKDEKFDAHYGKGNWEVVWIDDARKDFITDEGFKTAIARSAEEEQEDHRASITLEMSDGSKVEKKL